MALEIARCVDDESGGGDSGCSGCKMALSEVCDDELHSYAILFKTLDDVTLMIDGRKFKSTERVPEILDDWPLHDTKQLVGDCCSRMSANILFCSYVLQKTKLIVGACWHGRSQSMTQFFKVTKKGP